ncbi:Uncharacterized protein FWK35_00036645, partial [Aphis craccivora]
PPTKPRSRQEEEQRAYKQAVKSREDKIKFQKDGIYCMSDRDSINWQVVAYNPETFKIKMVNPEKLNLQGATALVPAFSGGTESDLVSFVAKCEFIFNNISDAIKPNILEAKLAQLTGKALSAVRVEKTAHELTNALTVSRDALDAEIIAQTARAHALSVFIAGIPQTIGLLLKALNIQVFEEAVLIAMEEETTAEFYNNMSGYNKSPNYKNNKFDKNNTRDKSAIKCHRCEKFGHYANKYRKSEHKIANFRNPNNGQSPKTEFKREYS